MTVARQTGTSTLSYTLEPSAGFVLSEVRLTLSDQGGANAFTCTLDSAADTGGVYDNVIISQEMGTVKNYSIIYETPRQFFQGDKLVFAWNNNFNRTWGLEVVWDIRE